MSRSSRPSAARHLHGAATPRRAAARRTALASLAAVLAAAVTATGAAPAQAWGTPEIAGPDSVAAKPAMQPYVVDGFDRTVSSSWGSTPASGTWTKAGGGSLAVASGRGTMSTPASATAAARIITTKGTDTETQVRVRFDTLPSAGAAAVQVVGRSVNQTSGYRLKLRATPTGATTVSVVRVNGTSTTTLLTSSKSFSVAGGKDLQVRLRVAGSGTTALRAKVWEAGTTEPTSWTLSTSDSTSALQTKGGVALMTTVSAGTTRRVATSFDGVWAGPTAAAPPVVRTIPKPGTYVPSATTTGVPAGTLLKVHEGDLTITRDGTVVDGLDVRGFVTVKATGVTIRNTVVRGRPTTVQRGLVVSETGSSLTIEDSELFNATPNWYVDGLRGSGFTARRVNIHDVIDTVHVYNSNVRIEASWLHDTLHYTDDPSHDNGSHDDNIQVVRGTNLAVVGNRIDGAWNAAMQFTQGLGTVSNVTVAKNYIGGGGCSINVAESGRGAIEGLVLTDNTFGRDTRVENCAVIAPPATTAVLTTTNNTYTDGSAVLVRKG